MKYLKMLIIAIILLTSCTDASKEKMFGLGSQYKIELIDCNGNVVREWISTGKVLSESSSDGYYFQDSKTGKLIEVTGTLIISSYKEN